MQEQLQGQLTTLQQTLTKMQETITAQDAEIANLTRQIAARAQTSTLQSQAAASASSEEDDEDSNSYGRPAVYYWGAGLGLAVLAIILAKWVRRRNARSMRVPFEDVPFKKAASERPPSAAVVQSDVAPRDRSSPQRQSEDRKTSDRDDVSPSTSGGVESWRTQTALLERDVVFHTDHADHTDVLPFVMETGNQGKPAKNTLNQRSVEDEETVEIQIGHSGTHKEIVRALENTLNMEPDRVDIKLKLLEIYHHEAMGNRENFHSLLSRLSPDPQQLSPAQRSHVEMLQRTLQDELDTDSDRTAKIAI